MPITIEAPKTIVIDKIQIDSFSVDAQTGKVKIHFSRGYEENGVFIAKEYDSVDPKNAISDANLYSQVKIVLYDMLTTAIRDRELNKVDMMSEKSV